GLAVGAEHHHAALVWERGEHAPLAVDGDVRLVGDRLALPPARNRDAGQWIAVRAQLLDAVVPRFRCPDIALVIQGQANLFVELARAAAGAAEHPLERAVQTEDLDALVARVGDIDLARGTDGDLARSPEHAGLRRGAALGVAELPPLAEELAVRVE